MSPREWGADASGYDTMESSVNTHENYVSSAERRVSSDRSFGWLFTAFFAVVALLPLLHHRPVRLWAAALSAAVLLLTVVRPATLHSANVAWSKLGDLMGRIVNPLVMAILFFLVITPVGLLMRLLSKDILRLKWNSREGSYWIPRTPPGPDPKTMINQF